MRNRLAQKLAIACGWTPSQFVKPELAKSECVIILCDDGVQRYFSLKDRHMMWKVAEHFDAFPINREEGWTVDLRGFYNTPGEAVANYIINFKGN